MKRALALILAMILAFPSFAFADESIINPDDVLINEGVPEGGPDLFIENIDEPVLELPGDLGAPQSGENNAPDPVTLAAFDQTVTVDDFVISLSAEAGSLPADSVLRVDTLKDEATEQAVRKAAQAAVEGELTHHIYSIEVLDAAGKVVVPNIERHCRSCA